jgi:hypothetical protein
MVEPRVKQEECVTVGPAEPKERMFTDLTIDNDDGREGGPKLLVGEESESEEGESSWEELSSVEESGSDEDEDGNDHYRDRVSTNE